MNNAPCFLTDRGVIKIAGDATTLLHKVITNTMLDFSAGESRFSALLTAQGKLMFDFFILPLAEGPEHGYYIDCNKHQTADLIKRLTFHRMRAKFTIEDMNESLGVAAFWHGEAPAGLEGIVYRDTRAAGMGSRIIAPLAELTKLSDDQSGYEAHRVALGVPKGGADYVYGDTFVHDANLDHVHGVDFKKGCYVGQEVVARVHFRQSARKRIVKVLFAGPAPQIGTQIMAGDTSIGQISSIAGAEGLAMLRLDKLDDAKAAGLAVKAGETAVEALVPPEFVQSAAGVEKRL